MNAEDEGISLTGRRSPASQSSKVSEQLADDIRVFSITGGVLKAEDSEVVLDADLEDRPGMRFQFQLEDQSSDETDRIIKGGRVSLLPMRTGYAGFERERAELEIERQRIEDVARELKQRQRDLQLEYERLQEERNGFELLQRKMEQEHQARQEELDQREREACARQAEYDLREAREREERERQQDLQRLEFEKQERLRKERESTEYLYRSVPEAQRIRAHFERKFHDAFKETQSSAAFFFAQYQRVIEGRALDGGYTLERVRQGVRDYVRLSDDERLLIRFAQRLMELSQTPSQLDNREQVIRTFLGLRERIEVGYGLSRTTDRERSPQEPFLAGVFDLLAPFIRQYHTVASRERQLPDVSSTLRKIIHEARTSVTAEYLARIPS